MFNDVALDLPHTQNNLIKYLFYYVWNSWLYRTP